MQNALTLSIEGMHCGGCVRRVTTALQGVGGVEIGSVEVGSAIRTRRVPKRSLPLSIELAFPHRLRSQEEIAMSDALKIEGTGDAAAVSAGAVCGLLLSPVLASAAMALSSVSVVTNSLRWLKIA